MTQRTPNQNKSMHLYLTMLADELNAAGYDMRKVITMPIRATGENLKETMLKPIMNSLFPDVESTTELTTIQMMDVYEVMNAATAERLKVSIEWPSKERLYYEARGYVK